MVHFLVSNNLRDVHRRVLVGGATRRAHRYRR
jgi:hypothetical protein